MGKREVPLTQYWDLFRQVILDMEIGWYEYRIKELQAKRLIRVKKYKDIERKIFKDLGKLN